MELIGIPAIVVISYMITEIFMMFINNKYLPIVAGISCRVSDSFSSYRLHS